MPTSPTPLPAPPVEDIELLVIGRPGGGPIVDEKTGERANGGVSWYQSGETRNAEPGEYIEVPKSAVAGLLADGMCVLANEVPDADTEEPV